MRILITGVSGQVGWELRRSCQPLGEVLGVDRAALDLAQPDAIRAVLRRERPRVILNPAAYTAVDQAEQDEAAARRVNGDAVAVLADEAARVGALLVHYSTDYVFDGTQAAPHRESDRPRPAGAYGRSKLAAEQALQSSAASWLCLRTSWVYAARGRNFLRTILRLAAEREELRIVADQVGAPTAARLVADATAQIVARALAEQAAGTFTPAVLHLAAGGATSWHGFAECIVAGARGYPRAPSLKVRRLVPIASDEYPQAAPRPRNSRLDCSGLARRYGLELPRWECGVALCLEELFG
jgi:dTDP-4-dehydrorhamnose reductase